MPSLGTYRNRVTLSNPGEPVPDPDGGYTETFTPLDPPAWDCSIAQAAARDLESIGAGSVIAHATHLIKGRYHPGITTQTRVQLGGAVQPYADLVKAHGASHYWRLDDTGAVALDVIGGATGQITGGVTRGGPGALVDGTAAMTFDGTTGQIATAAIITLPIVGTVEMWIRGVDTANRPIVTMGPGTQAPTIYTLNRRLSFYDSANVIGAGANGLFADGPWHQGAIVFDGTTATFYIDGVMDRAGAPAPRTVANTGVVGIGYDPAFGPPDPRCFWIGSLDDVAIYPRALTAAEIAAHYAAGTKRATRTLSVLYVANRDERGIETDLVCAEVVA